MGSWAHLASEIDIRPKFPSASDLSFIQVCSTFDVMSFTGVFAYLLRQKLSLFNIFVFIRFFIGNYRPFTEVEPINYTAITYIPEVCGFTRPIY